MKGSGTPPPVIAVTEKGLALWVQRHGGDYRCKGRGGGGTIGAMAKDFEPLKARLRIIHDRLDPDEQAYFGPLIENFTGGLSEFQRIMRDLGKFGEKIGDGSKFAIYREIQHLYDQGNRGE